MSSTQVVPLEARLAHGGLLAAALAVFEKKGYAATRVEDILQAAGIARRTFYRQFKSKDDVLVALYGLATGELLAAMRDAEVGAGAGDDAHPLRGVHRAIDVYLDYHVHNAATLRVLLGQAMRPDSPLAAMRRTFRAALVRILSEVARAHGKDLAPLVFVALLSALEGVSFALLEEEEESPASAPRARKGRVRVAPADLEVARTTTHALLARVLDVDGPEFPHAPRPRAH